MSWADECRSIAETASDPNIFGFTAVYTPTITKPNMPPRPDPSCPAYEIMGVHDDPMVFAGDDQRKREDGLRETHIASTEPWFDAPLDRFRRPPAQGDQLLIRETGRFYRVADVRRAAFGVVRLMLDAAGYGRGA